MTTVHATELEYIDERSNSAKFYRVFDLGDEITTQYGRIGTFGTFTPRKKASAEKAITGKLAKGYNVVRTGTFEFAEPPTDSELDTACSHLIAGGVAGMPTDRSQSAVVVAANVETTVDPTVLVNVTEALTKLGQQWAMVPTPTNPTRPMLALEVRDAAQIDRMLDNAQWHTQVKLDGDRVMIEIVDGQVSALNRSGQPKVKNVGAAMLEPFRHLTEGRWVFDGEVVDRTLWLFDMPAAGLFHDEQEPFSARYAALCAVLAVLPHDDAAIQLVATAEKTSEKRSMFTDSFDAGKEGVIFRDVDAHYESGKRSPVLVKHKFLNEADCFVTAVGAKGKESVELGVFDAQDIERVVGNASTIGKTPTPKLGDVWEVRFLYVVSPDHPRMVQPRLVRLRTDKAAAECSIEQFAGAVTDKTVSQ
jgi:predicted DNA-binding WGR domain protein